MRRLVYDKPLKVCRDCKQLLSIDNFSFDSKQILRNGEVCYYARSQCKKCRLKTRREAHGKVAHLPEVKYKKRMRMLYERYGISAQQYLDLAEKQENLCAICGKPPGSKALAVDHDHATGEVRALLCVDCNLGLGRFRDNIEVMRQAIKYLQKHGIK